ncbi:MAG: hypothetical protein LBH53_03550, partial [Puniceicoccales bacterium]|nr:hypothetical protein [Puniceicoccales bacterium]
MWHSGATEEGAKVFTLFAAQLHEQSANFLAVVRVCGPLARKVVNIGSGSEDNQLAAAVDTALPGRR